MLEKLVARYKNGDTKAFDEIYQKTLPITKAAIFSYIKDPEDMKDLTQDVYLKLTTKIDNYKGGSFENFIYTMAKNTAIDFLRKKKEEKIDDIDSISSNNINPCLKFAINTLDELHKNIFLMKVLLNTSTKQLSKIFNMSPYEVNKAYKEAKIILRKELKGYEIK